MSQTIHLRALSQDLSFNLSQVDAYVAQQRIRSDVAPLLREAWAITLDANRSITAVERMERGQPSEIPTAWSGVHRLIGDLRERALASLPEPNDVVVFDTEYFGQHGGMKHESYQRFSCVGGGIPQGLQIPRVDRAGGLHYVGTIGTLGEDQDEGEPGWSTWIEEPIHILFPLFSGSMSRLDLDCRDRLAPTLVDPNFGDQLIEQVPPLPDGTVVEYECLAFIEYILTPDQAYLASYEGRGIGTGGVPRWLQAPELPLCPRTGEPMQFLVQLSSTSAPVVKGRFDGADPRYAQWFGTLTFWGDGELYAFYHPGSQILSVFVQNT